MLTASASPLTCSLCTAPEFILQIGFLLNDQAIQCGAKNGATKIPEYKPEFNGRPITMQNPK